MSRTVAALIILLLLAGCRNESPGQQSGEGSTGDPSIAGAITPSATFTATPLPTMTFTPSATPTATNTPTPTSTPTPTAEPMAVSGDPRTSMLSLPTPQGNAACGMVDTLDFPINPPDAMGVARGGQDFGRFRSRYDGYHAGEDWWTARGGSSFGSPVYAIGHGLVTYAQPFGWGRDQGVIIIRHTFQDGSTILSFYGHLDPPSVIIRAGQCVTRGEKIGEIGRPRSTPHLHFEIRSHMPYETGGGYWAEDPTLAGWKPPSQYIWNSRIALSPGVVWTRPPEVQDPEGIGIFHGNTFIAIEEDRLVGIDVTSGSLLWNHSELDRIDEAILDQSEPLVYTSNQFGRVHAYSFPDPEDEQSGVESEEPLWTVDHDVVGFPTLMPLPQGGLILYVQDQLLAISREGRLSWQLEAMTRPYDWVMTEDGLVFTTVGRERSIWTVGENGPESWHQSYSGYLASDGANTYLYSDNGISKLDTENRTVELLYSLPEGTLALGDLMALPDGGVLVAHADRFDRRLINLSPDGRLRWERSYRDQVSGAVELLILGQHLYLVSNDVEGSLSSLTVYSLDVESAELLKIFSGGTRTSGIHLSRTYPAGDRLLLIDIGGGSLAALDVTVAAEVIAGSPESP